MIVETEQNIYLYGGAGRGTSVTANTTGTSASAAKKVTVAKGPYSVPPGTSGKAKAKLTKAGKRLAKAKGKLKAKVKVTNTINNVSQTFKVKF